MDIYIQNDKQVYRRQNCTKKETFILACTIVNCTSYMTKACCFHHERSSITLNVGVQRGKKYHIFMYNVYEYFIYQYYIPLPPSPLSVLHEQVNSPRVGKALHMWESFLHPPYM